MMPQVAGGPKDLNNLLESVYQSCRSDGGSKTKCSKEAWAAARSAGWRKDDEGNWVKKSVFCGLFKIRTVNKVFGEENG
jgi:hypothetical protein